MKVVVLRTFYDARHNNTLRTRGSRYEETSKTRITDLESGGFVKPLDQPIEQPTGKTATETKKKPRKKPAKK